MRTPALRRGLRGVKRPRRQPRLEGQLPVPDARQLPNLTRAIGIKHGRAVPRGRRIPMHRARGRAPPRHPPTHRPRQIRKGV
jgi:hypothetical protein